MADRNLYNEGRVQYLQRQRRDGGAERQNWRRPSCDDDDYSSINQEFTPTELPDTHQTVYKEGGFDECVRITDQAYEDIINLATNERTKDKWTKESMHNYLKYMWIRLMEQHRVLNIDASAQKAGTCKEILESAGISEIFAAFNTGLVDGNGEDIFAVLVQSSPGKSEECGQPYTLYQSGITLQHSGVFVTTDDGKTTPLIDYLQMLLEKMLDNDRTDNPLIYHNTSLQAPLRLALSESLKKASFFAPRDENLLLDWTADIMCKEHHIIKERLDRFLEVGVIDEHEAVILDQEEKVDCLFKEVECRGEKKYIKMFSETAFHFRREKFGVNACALKLNHWISDAKQRVQGTFTLAVPQIYYQLIENKYTGRLQLLIPLFCGTNKAKLALSLDYKNGKYWANTVLKIQWAYSNARLLAAPQANWILQDMD